MSLPMSSRGSSRARAASRGGWVVVMFSPVREAFRRVATRALPRVQITDPRVQANPSVSRRASRAKVASMTLSLDDLARAVVVRDTDVMRLDLGDRWAKR